MSIYDKASLVLIPSGTKTSKVYSQKPTNGDGDFTFSRSTAATRVNASGNIEKETQNLYIRSQEMDNAIWSKSRGSVTANATAAPDGTTTADLWTEDTSNGTHDIRQGTTTSSGSFYMFSIYAKANGRNVLDVYVGGANKSANFNLTTGLVTGGSAPIRKIEDVGSGWYRVSVGVLAASTTTTAIWILNNGSTQSYTGDGTSGMYFWGAQAEQSIVARNYIETTTSAIYGGITDNVPRLDYTDSSCPALLLEPQRTNLVTQSEYLGDSSWSPFNATITSNYGTSPEGVQNSSRIVCSNTTDSRVFIPYGGTLTDGTKYTWSGWYKGTAGEKVVINAISSGGSAVNASKVITFTGDWQRENVTFTAGTSLTYVFPNDARVGSDTTATDFEYFGAQLEAGSYATSYIPTYGSAVTRNQEELDAFNIGNYINDDAGVLFAEFIFNQSDTSQTICLNDNTTAERIGFWTPTSNDLHIFAVANGSSQFSTDTGFNLVDGNQYKVIVKWENNIVKGFANGSLVFTSSSITMPENLYVASTSNASTTFWDSPIRSYMVFPTALTDQEAIDLTTI